METKEIKAAAKAHAKEQLGSEQFKANKDAARAIAEDFEAGAQLLLPRLRKAEALTDGQKATEALVSVANGLAEAIDAGDLSLVCEVWRNIADVLVGKDATVLDLLRIVPPPTSPR